MVSVGASVGASVSAAVHERPGRFAGRRRRTAALTDDPYPPEGVHHGEYHRLHVGEYRVVYVIDPDRLTIERVDRVD